MPTTTEPAADITPPIIERTRKPIGWLLALVTIVAVALAAAAALWLVSDDGPTAEEVVVDSLEAFNARDRATLEELYARTW